MASYRGKTFTNAKGESLIYGEWYNYGGNVSVRRISPNGYRLRLDPTGEVIVPAGPAAQDSLAASLHYSRTPESYSYYNFGDAFIPPA